MIKFSNQMKTNEREETGRTIINRTGNLVNLFGTFNSFQLQGHGKESIDKSTVHKISH